MSEVGTGGRLGVLLVEDNVGHLRTLSDLLDDEGFEVYAAPTVGDGKRLLEDREVAVAVVDQHLPDATGVDLLRWIRERGLAVSVIINTGYGAFDSAKEAVNLGAFAYVEKVGPPDELLRQVHRGARAYVQGVLDVSEAKVTAIYDSAYDGILVVDASSGEVVDCNPRAGDMLGFAVGALPGVKLDRLSPGGELASFVASIPSAGRGAIAEMALVTAHGATLPAEVSGSALGSTGWPRVVLLARDVTPRHRAAAALEASEARLRAFFDYSPMAMALTAPDGRSLKANRAFECYFGNPPSAGDGARLAAHRQQVVDAVAPFETELEVVNANGRRTVILTLFPVSSSGGELVGVGEVGNDITERKQAEISLARSEARYQGLYDSAPDMYFTLDDEGTVRSVNLFGAHYLGYLPGDLVGRAIYEMIHAADQLPARECWSAGATDAGVRGSGGLELRIYRKSGEVLWVQERSHRVDGDADRCELRVVLRDVTEAHELSAELSYQATHDSLTGLVNRREVELRLARVIDSARDEGTCHALCYLDLDQFKVINDTCGHIAGDELLRQLGGVLSNQVRHRDTVARLGGDEFALLMEHCTLEQAGRAATAIRNAIDAFRFTWRDHAFAVGVSIGVVAIDPDSASASAVMSAADAACYVAKDTGRNRIHIHRDDDEELAARQRQMEWVGRLGRALDEERFRLYHQAILPVAGGAEPAMCEVLLRLDEGDGKLVSPGAFLPSAERYGLAGRIDRWVVSRTFARMADPGAPLAAFDIVCINLCGASLADDDFPSFVEAEMASAGIEPGRICFEVTESAAISNLERTGAFIGRLKARGGYFAIDDFGSGLSSFGLLKRLPVDYLKIDGAFVRDIATEPVDHAMIRSIAEVARIVGRRTVAEGVEDEAVLACLVELGIDFAQGHLLGAPVPA